MDKCLFDAKNIMDELNIPFYVCTGTALGFRREGDFIPHDYDIDIAMDEQYSTSSVLYAFTSKGVFKARFLPTLNDRHVELSFKHVATNIDLDIFITFSHIVDGKQVGVYNILWDLNGRNGRGMGSPILMYYTPYSLELVNYKDTMFLCPDSSYIVQTYGEGWSIPVDFKKIGGDPYLASLSKKYRPNLINIEESRVILEEKFGSPLLSARVE